MDIKGLSDLQKDLLNTSKQLDKAMPAIMRKVGSKARTKVAQRARRLVKKKTGTYHSRWKRGKAFIDPGGDHTVRVYNSSPHAHLIEDGHKQVTADGQTVGFVPGKKVMKKAMSEFESSGQQTQEISKAIDELLRKNKL